MENDEQTEDVVRELLGQKIDTQQYYFDIYGEQTEMREGLHSQIINAILDKGSWSKNKQIYMLGGAPANGKSSFLNSGIVTYPVNALKIDPDQVKAMLPEYMLMVRNKELLAAVLVHEESSSIAKQIRTFAMEQGIDLIIDGVANDTFTKRLEEVKEMQSYGYSVRIDYVTLDTELSLQLAQKRFAETGRMVPQDYIKEKNKMIALLIPQLIKADIFDELYLWDTNDESNPRLILSQKSGKLEIENSLLFGNFKIKGND